MSSPSKTNADFSSGINIGGIQILVGSTSATILAGSVTAPRGSLFINTAGSSTSNRMYVNTLGGTAWTAVTTAA
jgi:hypothetical protein